MQIDDLGNLACRYLSGGLTLRYQQSAGSVGNISYITYSLNDFDTFNAQYNPGCGVPCGDFSKAHMVCVWLRLLGCLKPTPFPNGGPFCIHPPSLSFTLRCSLSLPNPRTLPIPSP